MSGEAAINKRSISLADLATALGGTLHAGDAEVTVSRISDMEEASAGDVVFLIGKRLKAVAPTKATCAVVREGITDSPIPYISCTNVNLAFAKAVSLLHPESIPLPKKGVHSSAVIGAGVALGKEVAIGANVVLEDGVSIGDGTAIFANTYIGVETKVGEECCIYPNVTIRERITIGDRVIMHPGVVIGADGFGYERTFAGFEKIPQIGDVIIEDDVEIGAGTNIDRAKIAHTRIGRGTKIDNLVQIAHNVTTGDNCLIVALCGIAGSVKFGNNVMMGGQVGVSDHVQIGDNAMIAAQSGLMKNVEPNSVLWGTPAIPFKKATEMYILAARLPELNKRVRALEKKIQGATGGQGKDDTK